jgi:hypothetical protein
VRNGPKPTRSYPKSKSNFQNLKFSKSLPVTFMNDESAFLNVSARNFGRAEYVDNHGVRRYAIQLGLCPQR